MDGRKTIDEEQKAQAIIENTVSISGDVWILTKHLITEWQTPPQGLWRRYSRQVWYLCHERWNNNYFHTCCWRHMRDCQYLPPSCWRPNTVWPLSGQVGCWPCRGSSFLSSLKDSFSTPFLPSAYIPTQMGGFFTHPFTCRSSTCKALHSDVLVFDPSPSKNSPFSQSALVILYPHPFNSVDSITCPPIHPVVATQLMRISNQGSRAPDWLKRKTNFPTWLLSDN